MWRPIVAALVVANLGCGVARSSGQRAQPIASPEAAAKTPQPDVEVYQPPPIPPDAVCYELDLTDWTTVDTQQFAWFLPPKVLALTQEPHPDGLDRSASRILPDRNPSDPTRRMPFAMWWREGSTIVISWGNGFAGLGMKLEEKGSRVEGTGRTSSDNLSEQRHEFKVQGRKVSCAIAGEAGANARRRPTKG